MKPPRKTPGKPRSSSPRRPPRAGADAPARPSRHETARKVAESWGVEPDAPAKKEGKSRGTRPAASKGKTDRIPTPAKDGKRAALKPRPPKDAPGKSATGRRTTDRSAPAARPVSPRPPSAAQAAPRIHAPGEPQRIAKLLARAGVASRREIERMIAEGRIALDGVAIDTPATLLPSLKGVTVDGQPVASAEATRLFLFHKPAGCLTAERDFSGRRTIYDVLPKGLPRLMPVGRLDMTTEGLLLLTNDGELKRRLELPSTGVERSYRARAFGTVTQAQLEELIEGVEIEGMRYGRIDANLERSTGHNKWIELTLTEGKNREVRRVLEHLGLTVNRLIRTRYGPFELGDSAPGALVEVKKGELDRFLHALKGRG